MGIFKNTKTQWNKCAPYEQTQRQLRQWFQALPGRWLSEREQLLLESVLGDLFGYYLLQVGFHDHCEYLNCSRISFRVIMDANCDSIPAGSEEVTTKNVFFSALPEQFPVVADSLDVVLLRHSLEFSNNPHQVLRETDRVLIPEGHVVILGFNPWGLWFLWRLVLGWRKKPPWCARFIRLARLKDWLQLLGFDIVTTQHYFFRPPLSSKKVMHKIKFIEKLGERIWPAFGGAYMVVAKKRVATLTPIKPRWRPRRSRLVAPELAGNSSVSTRDSDTNNSTTKSKST